MPPGDSPKDEQAVQLRRLMRADGDSSAVSAGGRVMLVGAKGGVGVTTLAWQLARSLNETGTSTLAIDANPLQPDLSRVAGAGQGGAIGLAEVLSGEADANDAIQIDDNAALLPGSWDATPDTASGARLIETLNHAGRRFQTTVIDAGVARSPFAVELWPVVDLVLLVSTPDELSVLASYSQIKLATRSRPATPMQLIVNRCGGEAHSRSVYAGVRDTCRRFLDRSVSLTGWLPEDARIADRSAPPLPLMHPLSQRVREALEDRLSAPAVADAA